MRVPLSQVRRRRHSSQPDLLAAHELSARHAALHCAVLAIVQRARSLCGPGAGPGSVSGAPWLLLGGMRRGGAPGHEAAGASAMPQARCGREPGRRRRRAQDRDNFTQQPELPEALAAAQHIDRAAAEQGVLPVRGSARRAGGLARHPHGAARRHRRRTRCASQQVQQLLPLALGECGGGSAEAAQPQAESREPSVAGCGKAFDTFAAPLRRRHRAQLQAAAWGRPRRAHRRRAPGVQRHARVPVSLRLLMRRRVRIRETLLRRRRWLGGTASAQRGRAMQPSCQELRMQHMALTICTRTPNLEHGACARDRRRAAVEATPVSERALVVLASPRASATHVLMRPPRALQLFCSVLPHRARRRNIQLQLQCRHCGTARLSTPALTLPSRVHAPPSPSIARGARHARAPAPPACTTFGALTAPLAALQIPASGASGGLSAAPTAPGSGAAGGSCERVRSRGA